MRGVRRSAHVSPLLADLKWPSLDTLIVERDVAQVHNLLYNPQADGHHAHHRAEVSDRETRASVAGHYPLGFLTFHPFLNFSTYARLFWCVFLSDQRCIVCFPQSFRFEPPNGQTLAKSGILPAMSVLLPKRGSTVIRFKFWEQIRNPIVSQLSIPHLWWFAHFYFWPPIIISKFQSRWWGWKRNFWKDKLTTLISEKTHQNRRAHVEKLKSWKVTNPTGHLQLFRVRTEHARLFFSVPPCSGLHLCWSEGGSLCTDVP